MRENAGNNAAIRIHERSPRSICWDENVDRSSGVDRSVSGSRIRQEGAEKTQEGFVRLRQISSDQGGRDARKKSPLKTRRSEFIHRLRFYGVKLRARSNHDQDLFSGGLAVVNLVIAMHLLGKPSQELNSWS